jgi:hypothetical protein
LEISLDYSKSGSLSPNLTFFGASCGHYEASLKKAKYSVGANAALWGFYFFKIQEK